MQNSHQQHTQQQEQKQHQQKQQRVQQQVSASAVNLTLPRQKARGQGCQKCVADGHRASSPQSEPEAYSSRAGEGQDDNVGLVSGLMGGLLSPTGSMGSYISSFFKSS